jgi:hypothetical protein
MVDGGGPPEQCLRYGMPSLSEAPNGGARAFGYFALFKVTRRKGGTLSRHYRSNGYVLNPIQSNPKISQVKSRIFTRQKPAKRWWRIRIDDAEKQMISTEIGRHTDDPQLQQWLDEEVARPLDAADVARSATDPAIAAEMYLASVMLVDDQQDAERSYLDELAAALKIDPELQVHLEQQAKGGAA